MLKLISHQDARRLRDFFLETGYADVRDRLRLSELSSPRLRNIPRLLDSTQEPTPLNLLVRWFWIGVPQDASPDGKVIPPWVTTLMLDCGLLRQEREQLIPQAMLIPIEKALIWSDQTSRMDSGHSDVVLWPNPTSRLLSNFAIRRPSRLTLDLGSGNGIQTIAAAVHSEQVVATDLNPRAAEFARFNLRLNDIENAEYLLGDTFEPVAGRTFDLILSNPPFFISPHDRYLFCDNPMELDGLVRHIARQAPTYLNENGYFQMLCEWAQIKGHLWQERVVEWFKDSGCDVWIMKGHTQDPSDYAQDRVRDIGAAEKDDAALYDSYMAYYRKHNVEAIHDGLIAMRRRSGRNWITIQEVPYTPRVPFGDSIEQIFVARDFLQSHASDEQMLSTKPKMSPDARLEQTLQPAENGWDLQSLNLTIIKGVPFSVAVQPLVAEFLGGCDGTRTLEELIQALGKQVNVPIEQVRKECLEVVRNLIERRCMIGQA